MVIEQVYRQVAAWDQACPYGCLGDVDSDYDEKFTDIQGPWGESAGASASWSGLYGSSANSSSTATQDSILTPVQFTGSAYGTTSGGARTGSYYVPGDPPTLQPGDPGSFGTYSRSDLRVYFRPLENVYFDIYGYVSAMVTSPSSVAYVLLEDAQTGTDLFLNSNETPLAPDTGQGVLLANRTYMLEALAFSYDSNSSPFSPNGATTHSNIVSWDFSLDLTPGPAAVDDGPVAVPVGVPTVIPVGANDVNFSGPVTLTVLSGPSLGAISAISPPGPAATMTITYTADLASSGIDGIVYEMSDGTVSDTATVTVTIGPDADGDGMADPTDNCVARPNSGQCDSDGDGYGNRCDGDMNNNGATNAQDTVLFRQQLGQPSVASTYNKADINCNGAVNAQDTTLFRQLLGSPPGPSGSVL